MEILRGFLENYILFPAVKEFKKIGQDLPNNLHHERLVYLLGHGSN